MYLPDSLDFFQLMFALREEGYTFEMIRQILSQQIDPPNNVQLKEWVMEWVNIYQEKADTNDHDQSRSIQINPDQSRLVGISPDQSGLIQSNPDQPAGQQADVNNERVDNDDTSFQKELLNIRDEAVANAKEHTDQQLSKLRNEFANSMVTLIAEANNVLTEYYKKIYHLEGIIEQIYTRLEQLEQNSGNSIGQEISLDEVEIEKFQIDPKSFGSNSTDRAGENNNPPRVDLDFVRNSITQGKPDKDVIIKWIQSQRNKDYSYGDMASILNQAGVPTLRGKEGWSRGMVRNLAVRGNGEYN